MNLSTDAKNRAQAAGTDAAPARKYMFDRSFDDASVVHRAQERKPVLMKPEQIDGLKKEAYDAGYAAGVTAGKNEQTARLEAVVAKVDHNMGVIVRSMAALAEEQHSHTRQLVLTIAKKILPSFTAKNGLDEVETLLNDTIKEMAREPRLVVRVSEPDFDAVNERVQTIATNRAYSGKVIVLADKDVTSGDCRIEWADGGVERNVDATMKQVEHVILPTS